MAFAHASPDSPNLSSQSISEKYTVLDDTCLAVTNLDPSLVKKLSCEVESIRLLDILTQNCVMTSYSRAVIEIRLLRLLFNLMNPFSWFSDFEDIFHLECDFF